MKNDTLNLYLEINSSELIFFVIENDEQNNSKIFYEVKASIIGIDDNRISDFEKFFNIIKVNIIKIEQEINYTFKEIVLILENFNPTFINLSGYKKLNGSQILRENIIYILNTLKSYVNEIESKKTLLHIFNSKFFLDKKNIENLPIGLFGDFYSHELSLALIDTNNFKNLRTILKNCNIKTKKILLKSFLKGAYLSDEYPKTDTFYTIEINSSNSKIFYFENNSLKFEQKFKFGFDIILKDISKITSLSHDTIEKILAKINSRDEILSEKNIEKEFFVQDHYRPIKKRLIHQVAFARIEEISNIILHKNINLKHYNKNPKVIFLEINNKFKIENFKDDFKNTFSSNNKFDVKFLNNLIWSDMIKSLSKLVHFGWKKEAIPVSESKKTKIARFFDALFG